MSDPFFCQRVKILSALKRHPVSGMTNVELSRIALRFGARLMEIRRKGFKVKTECLARGLYRYTLLENK